MEDEFQTPMDRLVRLPEGDAEHRFLDERNSRVLFRLLLLAAAIAVVLSLVFLGSEAYPRMALPLANLVLIRGLFLIRERKVFTQHQRAFLLGTLITQFLFWMLYYTDPFGDLGNFASFHPLDLLPPFLLVLFRLPGRHLIIPLGFLWLAVIGRHLLGVATTEQQLIIGLLVGYTLISWIILAVTSALTRGLRRDFLDDYRREQRRYRERQRMRDELDDARRMQLSMLPRSEPRLPWLDVAGISIPANEVGGDYYGYFPIDDERQGFAICDVAGHGMASGLILAGVRRCLVLLHENPTTPIDVLKRLDRMLRHTTGGGRSFVTILYAILDHQAGEITLAAAGHPPIIAYRAITDSVEEIGSPALPLGTRLGSKPEQLTVGVASGDILVLMTDGVAETAGLSGQLYGDQRFSKRLLSLARAHDDARRIREGLLADIWNFKGDAEQTDDITLVVIRLR
ncbi:MAG: PP2C family protein-serine/threonine phosphatase [Acidobacteriota bacterium]